MKFIKKDKGECLKMMNCHGIPHTKSYIRDNANLRYLRGNLKRMKIWKN